MKKLRLYIDSSLLGWSLNPNNHKWFAEANLLLQQISQGEFIGAYSWITEGEIINAPMRIARKLQKKVKEAKMKKVSIGLEEKAEALAQQYCNKGIINRDFKNDALHIAIATLWEADALVSYNFQHIVNLEIMVRVNKVNFILGLKEIFLCQPQEVINSEN